MNIFEKLGTAFARWRLRKVGRESFDLHEVVSSVRRVLVVLPPGDLTVEELDLLVSPLSPEGVTLLCVGRPSIAVDGWEVRELSHEDLTLLRLPKKEALKEFGGYDLAVDLHLPYFLPSAYICGTSGASLRVSTDPEAPFPFFNLRYSTGAESLGDRCRSLGKLFMSLAWGRRACS